MELDLLPGDFAICRLEPGDAVPAWAWTGALASVTRTGAELSIVCDAAAVPADVVRAERGWRALSVRGPLPFELTGVAAALTGPLAEAGISVFLVASYDTDHVLVRAEAVKRAIAALAAAGHAVDRPAG
jgi:hypothetical protein